MKPAAFEYRIARSIEEAQSFLTDFGSEAKILAGGQSLIPMMKLRLARPTVLVDINNIKKLDTVTRSHDRISIGAVRRLHSLETDELFGASSLILQALPHIGHVATRNRGTICGSLAHADPAAELPVIASCLDAEIIASSDRGERHIRAIDFFSGFFTTSLEPDEMVREVRFPLLENDAGYSFQELSKRHAKFALAAVMISTDDDGRISEARISVGAVGETPFRATESEALIVGETGGTELFRAVAANSVKEIDPPSDVHGTGVFRRKAAQTLIERALGEAWRQSTTSKSGATLAGE